MPRKDLNAMIEEMDYPNDVAEAVRNDVAKNGNEARITTGELRLPARQDAIHWHDRLHGRFGLNEDQKALEQRVRELEGQLASHKPESPPWVSQPSSTQSVQPASTQ